MRQFYRFTATTGTFAVLWATFWAVWFYFFNEVPVSRSISFGLFALPVTEALRSRWADVPGAVIYGGIILLYFDKVRRETPENYERPYALSGILTSVLLVSFVIALTGLTGFTVIAFGIVGTVTSATAGTRFYFLDDEGRADNALLWSMSASSLGAGLVTNLSIGVVVMIVSFIAMIVGVLTVMGVRRIVHSLHPPKNTVPAGIRNKNPAQD